MVLTLIYTRPGGPFLDINPSWRSLPWYKPVLEVLTLIHTRPGVTYLDINPSWSGRYWYEPVLDVLTWIYWYKPVLEVLTLIQTRSGGSYLDINPSWRFLPWYKPVLEVLPPSPRTPGNLNSQTCTRTGSAHPALNNNKNLGMENHRKYILIKLSFPWTFLRTWDTFRTYRVSQ